MSNERQQGGGACLTLLYFSSTQKVLTNGGFFVWAPEIDLIHDCIVVYAMSVNVLGCMLPTPSDVAHQLHG